MYEVKTPSSGNGGIPGGNKRRSWAGRLRDRFKGRPAAEAAAAAGRGAVTEDEWLLDPWIAKHHPHLHDGHHAQPLPALQGSVFVAANFVYDCRQQYGIDAARSG